MTGVYYLAKTIRLVMTTSKAIAANTISIDIPPLYNNTIEATIFQYPS